MRTIFIEVDVNDYVDLLSVRVQLPVPVQALRISASTLTPTSVTALPFPGRKIKRNDVAHPIEPPLVAEYVADSSGVNAKRIDVVKSLEAMGLTIEQLKAMKCKRGSTEERLKRAYVMQKMHREREGLTDDLSARRSAAS